MDNLNIQQYVDDYILGKATTAEHQQFYDNNSTAIEAEFRARKTNQIPGEQIKEAADRALEAKQPEVLPYTIELEEVPEVTSPLAEKWAAYSEGLRSTLENLGEDIGKQIPGLKRLIPEFGERHLAIGGLGAGLAIMGGSLIINKLASTQHNGRTKRGRLHGTDAGAVLGLGAGLGVLSKYRSPQAAAAAMALGVLAGNSLYDHRFRHGDVRTNIVKNSIVAATSLVVHDQSRRIMPLAVQSFSTHLARFQPPGAQEFLNSIRKLPGVAAILNIEGMSLALAAASVPISHSIITRALAKQHRRHNVRAAQNAILPSAMEHQAGAQGGQQYVGHVSDPSMPVADVSVVSSLRTHYDMDRAQRALV